MKPDIPCIHQQMDDALLPAFAGFAGTVGLASIADYYFPGSAPTVATGTILTICIGGAILARRNSDRNVDAHHD